MWGLEPFNQPPKTCGEKTSRFLSPGYPVTAMYRAMPFADAEAKEGSLAEQPTTAPDADTRKAIIRRENGLPHLTYSDSSNCTRRRSKKTKIASYPSRTAPTSSASAAVTTPSSGGDRLWPPDKSQPNVGCVERPKNQQKTFGCGVQPWMLPVKDYIWDAPLMNQFASQLRH